MALKVPGGALASALQYSSAQRLTDLMPTIGDALVAGYCPFQSPTRMPGVAALGDTIGLFEPFAARRTLDGKFPSGRGSGAKFVEKNGSVVASTLTGPVELYAKPLDHNSFGVGVLMYLDAAAFDGISDIIFGNDESGGATVQHRCARTGAGSYAHGVTWDGVTNSFYGANMDLLTHTKMDTPGWYMVAADRHGGNAGVCVNGRTAVVAPQAASVPTLSAIRLGASTPTGVSTGSFYSLAIVVDGPLAQDAARYAEFEQACQTVRNAILT